VGLLDEKIRSYIEPPPLIDSKDRTVKIWALKQKEGLEMRGKKQIFIFARHGETDCNKNGIIQGCRIDFPPNVEGIKQAGHIYKLLFIKPDIIISSPMKRARYMAEVVGKRMAIPVVYDSRWREGDFGNICGLTSKRVNELYPDRRAGKIHYSHNHLPFGGESRGDIIWRIFSAIRWIKDEFPNKIPLVVSHGTIISEVYWLYSGGRLRKAPHIENSSVHYMAF